METAGMNMHTQTCAEGVPTRHIGNGTTAASPEYYGHTSIGKSIFGASSSGLDLCEFSQKMVDLLTEAAKEALQAPDHEGMNLAFHLLDDARKYDSLYFRARGISNQELFYAAKKLGEWKTP